MQNRGKSIVLIGMMGAGKSSVGRFLCRRTGLSLFDTDEAIVERLGRSIPEIFAEMGEDHFRHCETEILRELQPEKPIVVVTGGGIVVRAENVTLLCRLGPVVWLDAKEETLFERARRRGGRPLLDEAHDPRARLSDLMESRRMLYAAAADFRIDTTELNHDEVTNEILKRIETLTGNERTTR